ncbi:MAG: dihydrolipoamide acetyltransferase family protein [Candidatus Brocadiia bacterium]
MLKEVQMPKLGQTVEEATIEAWHKSEGDPVEKGEVLLEITTDKATLEVESYFPGVVKKLLYTAGDTVPVNAVLAFIGEPEDEATDEQVQNALANAAAAAQPKAAPAPPPPEEPAPQPGAPEAPSQRPPSQPAPQAPPPPAAPSERPPERPYRILASPRARRVARERKTPLQLVQGSGPKGRILERDVLAYAQELEARRVTPTALELAYQRGVDLNRIAGSGPGGRIVRADVEEAPARPRVPLGQPVPLTAMRRVVAQRMAHSKSTIPHFYLTMDADMTRAVALRQELGEQGGRKVSFNDLIVRACALAFAEVPEMNVAWADGSVVYRREVNIGLAVAIEGGLLVPVVRGCERKSLAEIAAASAALIEKARNKRLTPEEYEGGCLTVSNLGMFGVATVAPIINPGEVAILGVGRIAPRALATEEGFVVRQMTTLTLACDHRLVDGVIGARFLDAVKTALEAPQTLT